MKKFLLVGTFILLCAVIVQAREPETDFLGDSAAFRNVTVSSYTTTAIISLAESRKLGDWIIKNNGSYDVFIASFTGANTSATNVFKLLAGESVSLGGKLYLDIYAITEKATSNTSRLDVIYIYKD